MSLNIFEKNYFEGPEGSFKLMFLVPLMILMSIAALGSIVSLDKTFVDNMVEVEMNARDKELEIYNDELEVVQHEVFRDLQMIKVLAENNQEEEIKDYIL